MRLAAEPSVDVARGERSVTDRDRDRAIVWHHVAAGKDALAAGHHVRSDADDAVGHLDLRDPLDQAEIGVLAEGEHERVGLELVELAGRLGVAAVVELHPFDDQTPGVGAFDRRQPAHENALFERFLDLEVVRRHPLARSAVDDDRLIGAEPLGSARGIERGVTAAVYDDPAGRASASPPPPCSAASRRRRPRVRRFRLGCRRASRSALRPRGTRRHSCPRPWRRRRRRRASRVRA